MKRIIAFVLALLVLAGLSVGLSSCSVMMPYHESFECNRGVNGGYCGPVDKVYQESVLQQQKEEGMAWQE